MNQWLYRRKHFCMLCKTLGRRQGWVHSLTVDGGTSVFTSFCMASHSSWIVFQQPSTLALHLSSSQILPRWGRCSFFIFFIFSGNNIGRLSQPVVTQGTWSTVTVPPPTSNEVCVRRRSVHRYRQDVSPTQMVIFGIWLSGARQTARSQWLWK